MGNKSPGYAINARQCGQRLIHQNRQMAEIAARQTGLNFMQLGFD